MRSLSRRTLRVVDSVSRGLVWFNVAGRGIPALCASPARPGKTVSGETDVAAVPEDARPETFVAHVTVTDADSGDGGRFTCSLSAGAAGAAGAGVVERFRLQATTHAGEFQVVTADEPLDHELVDRCVAQRYPHIYLLVYVPCIANQCIGVIGAIQSINQSCVFRVVQVIQEAQLSPRDRTMRRVS